MSRIPRVAVIIRVQPTIPIRLMAILDLWRIASLRFHLAPKESLSNIWLFSIRRRLIFLGEYGLNASAAVP